MPDPHFRTITATVLTAALLVAAPSFATGPELDQLKNTVKRELSAMGVSTDHLMQASLNDLVQIQAALDKGDSEAKLRIDHILGNDGQQLSNIEMPDASGGKGQPSSQMRKASA